MPQLIAALFVVLAPSVAHAYIGPGAGLTAIGSFVALVGAVVLAIVGFLWYPIKRMMRARAARSNAAPESRTGDSAQG